MDRTEAAWHTRSIQWELLYLFYIQLCVFVNPKLLVYSCLRSPPPFPFGNLCFLCLQSTLKKMQIKRNCKSDSVTLLLNPQDVGPQDKTLSTPCLGPQPGPAQPPPTLAPPHAHLLHHPPSQLPHPTTLPRQLSSSEASHHIPALGPCACCSLLGRGWFFSV